MRSLLRFFSLRHFFRHPVRIVLGAASISLGVALYVSISVCNHTIATSFENSVRDLAGKAELQIVRKRGVGVDAAALDLVRDVPGAIAAPVIQRSLNLQGLKDGTVMVLGIDFVRDSPVRMYKVEAKPEEMKDFITTAFVPNGVIVTRAFAERNGLVKGSKLSADTPRGRSTLIVTGMLQDEGPAKALNGSVALMSISAAQTLFSMPGRFDRIEVAPDGVGAAELERRLEAKLGDGYSVKRLSRKNTSVEVALARLRSMVIISAIALVVGLFIVYNSVSISVVERVKEIGILRALGAKRSQILATVLLEWTIVGVAGSAAGVGIGFLLAQGLLPTLGKTANQLMFAVSVQEAVFDPKTGVIAMLAGTFAAAAAAFFPAITAMRVSPVELLRQGTWQYRATGRYRTAFLIGVGLLAACAAALLGGSTKFHPYIILAITTAGFFAIALTGPQFALWIARALRPALRRVLRVEGWLAADNLSKFPQRTALTVVAYGGAISLMIASATMIGSMKAASERWMKHAFPFDLAVISTDLSTAIYSSAAYPEEVLQIARATDGVAMAYGVRASFQPRGQLEIMLLAVDTDTYFDMHRLRGGDSPVAALDNPAFREALKAGDRVVLSDNMARLEGLSPGDTIELATPDGPRDFVVHASVEDYSWPAGAVIMDRGAYKRLWKDDTLTYVDVRVKDGVPPSQVRDNLSAALRSHSTVFIYDVPQLQKIGRDAMDQALALANVQVLIALVIGFLGIVNTLLISVLRRTREIGLLRAVGTTRLQVARGVVVESVLIALTGSVVGILAGLLGGGWPIRLFLMRIAGFLVPFQIPWGTIGVALVASIVLGIAASVVPARRAAGLNVLDAVSFE